MQRAAMWKQLSSFFWLPLAIQEQRQVQGIQNLSQLRDRLAKQEWLRGTSLNGPICHHLHGMLFQHWLQLGLWSAVYPDAVHARVVLRAVICHHLQPDSANSQSFAACADRKGLARRHCLVVLFHVDELAKKSALHVPSFHMPPCLDQPRR